MSDFNLEDLHVDVLREIGNVGAGHATTSLSEFLGKSIKMTVPEVNILPFEEVPEVVGGPEKLVAGVYMRFEGEAPGSLMLLFDKADAQQLIELLMGDMAGPQDRSAELGEMERSALMETGNIVASSYLTAMGDMTKMEVSPTVPAVAVDMAGAILQVILFQVDEEISEHVILIGTEFSHENDKVRGHFFLIPDQESFPKILRTLGFDYGDR